MAYEALCTEPRIAKEQSNASDPYTIRTCVSRRRRQVSYGMGFRMPLDERVGLGIIGGAVSLTKTHKAC